MANHWPKAKAAHILHAMGSSAPAPMRTSLAHTRASPEAERIAREMIDEKRLGRPPESTKPVTMRKFSWQ